MVKTRDEIEELKRQWNADPCWDIEDTEGFEDNRDELLYHRQQKEVEWDKQRQDKLKKIAFDCGIPENLKLAQVLDMLQSRIVELETQLARF